MNRNKLQIIKKKIQPKANHQTAELVITSMRGFTLIELLVVISIIALLTSVLLVALSGARLRSRDAVRKQDISSVRKAIESYHIDNGLYPIPGSTGGAQDLSSLQGYLVPTYLGKLPVDPKGANYEYAWNNSGREYAVKIYFADGTSPCAWRTAGATSLFGATVNCTYQQ